MKVFHALRALARPALRWSVPALVIAAPGIAAADDVGHWYLTPQIGGISVDNDRPLQDKDWLYGLAVGKVVNRGLNVELNLNGSQIGGGPARSDLSLYGGSIDLLGVLNRGGVVQPFLSAGLGVAQNDRPKSDGGDATDFMSQVGVGMFIKAWESSDGSRTFSLRPELKARWDDAGADGHFRDYLGLLGFQYSFGAPAPKPVEAAPPPPPPPPPAPPPPPPPGDQDKDGVLDNVDKCPDTPAGVAVDAYGCTRKGSITLEGVTFEYNSATLKPESRSALDNVAADLKKYPRLKIELQGHTDSAGPDAYNLKLSQQRADSVRTYLLDQGVPASQLTAKGYGESQPIADNKTDEGRALNRRVVMSVLDNPGDVEVQGEGKVER
nr:OmpA family protein [uncultured Steroidobacter sp.]